VCTVRSGKRLQSQAVLTFKEDGPFFMLTLHSSENQRVSGGQEVRLLGWVAICLFIVPMKLPCYSV
jgi:hypothetical protein